MSGIYENTTAKTLAVGTQNLAALAGFFCVDTVERNVLATQFGYGIVTTSALSILGIIGLLKSSVKLSLGLEKCQKSGLVVDSLRNLFGYSPREAGSGDLVPCDEIEVEIFADRVSIRKTRRLFDVAARPILRVGSDFKRTLRGCTALNIGNVVYEKSIVQHPVMAALAAILWTGLTSWLILVIQTEGHQSWDWVLIFATLGLHTSLSAMLAAPIWFSFRCDRPGQAITGTNFDFLVRGKITPDNRLDRMIFTLYEINSGHGIFFQRGINFLHTRIFTAIMMLFSGLCVISYICQYTILKRGTSTTSAVWIGCQAALAFARLLYWIINCPIDKPSAQEAEYAVFDNKDFTGLNLFNLARLLPCGSTEFPKLIWKYLQQKSVQRIVEEAYDDDGDDTELGKNDLFLLDFPIAGLLANCNSCFGDLNSEDVAPSRLGLFYKQDQPDAPIVPRILIEYPGLIYSQNHSSETTTPEWIVLPQVVDIPGDEAKLRAPLRLIANTRAWCVGNTDGSVGFVPRKKHYLELGWVYPESKRHNAVVLGFRKTIERCRAEANEVEAKRDRTFSDIYFCATRRVIPREPDAWSEKPPPYAVAYHKAGFDRALNVTKEYIDQGHRRPYALTNNGFSVAALMKLLGHRFQARKHEKEGILAA